MFKPREQLALDLLVFKMQIRLAEGYTTLTLDDVNDVLYVARESVIVPGTNEEREVR